MYVEPHKLSLRNHWNDEMVFPSIGFTFEGAYNYYNKIITNFSISHFFEYDSNSETDAYSSFYLDLLINVFGGGPVGIETLAAALGEDATTLETVVEPYLMQIGFLQRTARGRVVTPAAEKLYLLASPNKTDK